MKRINATTDRAGNVTPRRRPPHASLYLESVGAPAKTGGPETRHRPRREHHWRPGGTEGNEILTSAAAVVLVVLLLAEGITIVHMQGLLSAHMFIGLVLIPPVLLKLGSTGYRMLSYYRGSRPYRVKGPPLLPLRLMAPVLLSSMLAVLATGVLMLAAGHKSGALLTIHKVSSIVFGVLLAVHLLAYLPRAMRSAHDDWRAARRQAVPGAGARAMLVAAAVGGGAALAVALLPTINAYGGH